MSLLVTISINQQKNINIFQGSHGKYYTINNNNSTLNDSSILNEEILKYDIHFPILWAEDNKEYILNEIQSKVGPKYCYNCIEYGYYNGVFIGYCSNCAQLLDYSRGNGLLPTGEEVNHETVAFDLSNIKIENSIWNTYLLYSNKEEIGDTLLKKNYELYKDLPPLIEIHE